jgi:hypothetical protein
MLSKNKEEEEDCGEKSVMQLARQFESQKTNNVSFPVASPLSFRCCCSFNMEKSVLEGMLRKNLRKP